MIWLDLLFLEEIHYDEGMENVNWVSLGALVFSSRHQGCPYCLGAVYKGVPFPLLAGIGPSVLFRADCLCPGGVMGREAFMSSGFSACIDSAGCLLFFFKPS